MPLSKLAKGGSDEETTPGSSPRMDADSEDKAICHVVVKNTFIQVTDGCSMMQRFKRFRKSKTDSALPDCTEEEIVLSDLEVKEKKPEEQSEDEKSEPLEETKPHLLEEEEEYKPGKYSDEQELQKHSSKGSDSTCPTPRDRPRKPRERTDRTRGRVTSTTDAKQEKTWQESWRTTVMMRNVPNNYTRDMLLEMFDKYGFKGHYDFVYLPHDFDRNANLGYAFVNLVSGAALKSFWKTFDGFGRWCLPTAKVCQVTWSGPHQGLDGHVERYRNSPVMHKSVPDEYKPLVFKDGVRQPFPCPTRKVKPPPKSDSR